MQIQEAVVVSHPSLVAGESISNTINANNTYEQMKATLKALVNNKQSLSSKGYDENKIITLQTQVNLLTNETDRLLSGINFFANRIIMDARRKNIIIITFNAINEPNLITCNQLRTIAQHHNKLRMLAGALLCIAAMISVAVGIQLASDHLIFPIIGAVACMGFFRTAYQIVGDDGRRCLGNIEDGVRSVAMKPPTV